MSNLLSRELCGEFCGMFQPPIRDQREGRPIIRYSAGPIQVTASKVQD